MKRQRTFERRAKRLVEKEKGKLGAKGFKLQRGVWFFPFIDEARQLIEIAKDCGLKEEKNIMLFTDMKPVIAPKELKKMDVQAEKEIEKIAQYVAGYGKGHQK